MLEVIVAAFQNKTLSKRSDTTSVSLCERRTCKIALKQRRAVKVRAATHRTNHAIGAVMIVGITEERRSSCASSVLTQLLVAVHNRGDAI